MVAIAFACYRFFRPLNSDFDVYVFFIILALELPDEIRIVLHRLERR